MIRAFVGAMGSGKTLSLVWTAARDLQEGRTVYTNFPFSTSVGTFRSRIDYIFKKNQIDTPLRPIYLEADEFLEAMTTAKNAVFCVDEANVVFSNRQWKNLDMKFIHRFSHNRKLGNDIYYTSQRFKHTEVRLRDLTNDVVECSFNHFLVWPYICQKIYLPDKFDFQFFQEDQAEKFLLGTNYIYGGQLKKLFNSYDTNFEITFSASVGKLYKNKQTDLSKYAIFTQNKPLEPTNNTFSKSSFVQDSTMPGKGFIKIKMYHKPSYKEVPPEYARHYQT